MSDRENLIAEQTFLTGRLAELPESARLTRQSAEARLRQIHNQLAQLPAAPPSRARVKLTFRGKPVVGSDGIFADFGMKAVNTFSDAVAAVAASLSAPLAAMGPIPNRDANQLLITGTAVGSFGFELQEASQLTQQAQSAEQTPVSRALAHTQSLLIGTISSDDELADAAAELDQRAIDKIRAFVAVLRDHDATCALQYGETVFRFNELAQVEAALNRLSADNLQESTITLEGQFEGMLPRRKAFEFRRSDSGEVITGRIAASVVRPELINEHLYQRVSIQVVETTVGRGRPRYLMTALLKGWDDAARQLDQS